MSVHICNNLELCSYDRYCTRGTEGVMHLLCDVIIMRRSVPNSLRCYPGRK